MGGDGVASHAQSQYKFFRLTATPIPSSWAAQTRSLGKPARGGAAFTHGLLRRPGNNPTRRETRCGTASTWGSRMAGRYRRLPASLRYVVLVSSLIRSSNDQARPGGAAGTRAGESSEKIRGG